RPAAPARSRTMRLVPLPLLAALALLTGGPPAEAQTPNKQKVVIFKDGFVVRGKVSRPTKIDFDPKSGAQYTIPTGYYFIDDEVRSIAFSPNQVHDVVDDESLQKLKPIRLGNAWIRAKGDALPREWTVLDVGDVGDRLERVVRIGTSRGY